MIDCRGVEEGTQCQGVVEQITWTVVLSPPPVSIQSVTVRDVSAGNINVTASVMPSGVPVLAGDSVVLPEMKNLVLGHGYVVSIVYDDAEGNVLETVFRVVCN